MVQDCLFCKIARGEMETEFLYEDDNLVVFKDIHPHAPVHLLLVPKQHIRSVNDLQESDRDIVAALFMAAPKIAKQVGVAEDGYKLLFNVERGGGQVIFHLHLHLMARKKSWRR
jgi:histidine triad (HIT) family protein